MPTTGAPIVQLRRKLRNTLSTVLALLISLYCLRSHIWLFVSRWRGSTTLNNLVLATLLACSVLHSFKSYKKVHRLPGPPKIKGKLPGNLDILWLLVQRESKEYCAETLRKWETEYGPTFDMNVLWSSQVGCETVIYVMNASYDH